MIKLGRTITISILVSWRNKLFETITYISEFAENNNFKPLPKSKLRINDNMKTFFEKINIIKNVATKTGKASKLAFYSLGEDGQTILELYNKSNNESNNEIKRNIEIRIKKLLHKLLIDAYFHYEFLLKFLRYFYFNRNNNEPIQKEELLRNLLKYAIMEIGTTEIFDKHTWDNLYNLAKGVGLLIEIDQDRTKFIKLSLEFFTEIDYKTLNKEIERKLQDSPYGMRTISICKYLLEYQTRFYIGTDLTIHEIYDLLKYLYIGKDPSIRSKFEFLGGTIYPPIKSAHCIIKLKT